jgi:hypothetical protein
MLATAIVALAIPWLTPVWFASPGPAWHTGHTGTLSEKVGNAHTPTPVATAWAATVRCSDCGKSDPPNKTLKRLPSHGVIVTASIRAPGQQLWPPVGRRLTANYAVSGAYRFPCCEAVGIGGISEMYGYGPGRAYAVLVRVYWGSPPDKSMRLAAQRAIRALHLPPAR